MKIEVTRNEKNVLEALVSMLYAEMGFSDVDCSDLAISTKMSIESIKGVVGSLTKKGLVNTENVTTHGRKIVRKRLVTYVVSTYQLVYLTDISYPLHPQYKKQVTSQLELIVE